MADRTLVWHLEGGVGLGDNQGPTYELDADYSALRVWIHSKTVFKRASVSEWRVELVDTLSIDIQTEYENVSTSIFTSPLPGIQAGSQVGERDYFADPRILKKGSLVKFNVTGVGPNGGGNDLTVQLELERV